MRFIFVCTCVGSQFPPPAFLVRRSGGVCFFSSSCSCCASLARCLLAARLTCAVICHSHTLSCFVRRRATSPRQKTHRRASFFSKNTHTYTHDCIIINISLAKISGGTSSSDKISRCDLMRRRRRTEPLRHRRARRLPPVRYRRRALPARPRRRLQLLPLQLRLRLRLLRRR